MLQIARETPITLSIALLAVAAFLFPSASVWIELDTTTSLLEQLPQIMGCHLLHWSLDHIGWDLLMFVLVGMICERKVRTSFVLVLVLSALAIPIFVANWTPAVDSYRGLSGIDTALFGFAALLLIEEAVRDRNWSSALLYGGLYGGMLAKIGYELTIGGTLFASAEMFSPVPIAHIVGAAIGSLAAGFQIHVTALQQATLRGHRLKTTA